MFTSQRNKQSGIALMIVLILMQVILMVCAYCLRMTSEELAFSDKNAYSQVVGATGGRPDF